jgi:ABC-type multidrug transport system permease subunit
MTSLKSLPSVRRKRAVLAVHLLIACTVMLGFAFHPDMGVRVAGVLGANLYLYGLGTFMLARLRRDAAVAVPVTA